MPITVHLKPEEVESRKKDLKEELINTALKKGIAKSREELAVRDVLPATDLGYSNEYFETDTLPQYSYTNVVHLRVPDRNVFGFYGVRDLSGGIGTGITSVIRFKLGPGEAATKNVFQIQKIESEKEKQGVFDEDVVYENGKYCTVEFYNIDTGVSRVALLGMVAEPKGEIVQQA